MDAAEHISKLEQVAEGRGLARKRFKMHEVSPGESPHPDSRHFADNVPFLRRFIRTSGQIDSQHLTHSNHAAVVAAREIAAGADPEKAMQAVLAKTDTAMRADIEALAEIIANEEGRAQRNENRLSELDRIIAERKNAHEKATEEVRVAAQKLDAAFAQRIAARDLVDQAVNEQRALTGQPRSSSGDAMAQRAFIRSLLMHQCPVLWKFFRGLVR